MLRSRVVEEDFRRKEGMQRKEEEGDLAAPFSLFPSPAKKKEEL